jgi:DNA-directed RNA polymerase subunit beta'
LSNPKLQEHIKMLDTVKGLVEEQFPVTSRNGRTLTATNFRWDQMGEQVFNDLKAQKAAKLGEKGVVSRLMADVTITDEDGSTIDSKMGHVLMNMPHLTPRNSYIVEGGGEVQVINQLRLRPGVYSHVKGDDEVEAHLNTSAAGTYKVLLDRKTGVIRFKVGTDKKVPIVVVMRALGASETEITETLGELADTNVKIANFDKDTTKLLTSLNRYAKVGSTLENQVAVKDFLHSKPMDAKVNKTTLGVDKGDKIDLAVVKGTVRKVMGLSKGRGKEDDKESLEFKSLHTIEDFVPERLRRSAKQRATTLSMLLQRKDSVPAILPLAMFNDSVNKLMTQSEFTRYSDQNNPIDMAAISTAVTVMGEGGIGSSRAITNDVRAIHPSQFGVIDVLHVPEGQKVGVTTHLSYGAKKVGNSIHIMAYNAKTGKAEQMAVEELMPKVVAFGDQYANMGKGVKPVLKEGVDKGKIKVRHNTDIKEVPATEVEYIFNDAATFFSSSSSVIPFLNSNSANRVLMADKHIEQTVQLADPDAPLVQHRLKGLGSGYMDAFGEQFLVKSPIKGTVQKVTEDAIFISPAEGGKRVEVTIHNHYPLNSKTYLDDTPIVKVGDKVTKGQALVKNNFTKNKTLALGKNLTTAMIPYKGYNFEDGTVISYAAAQKLASVHKAEHRVELGSNVTTGIESYVAHFPQNLEKLGSDYAERYDTQGVIKKGQKVTKGDILIPALREVSLSKTELSDLHRKVLATTHTDISATWDKDVDGEITDVVRNRKFIKVYVKSVEPAQIGDKLSAFAGAKGIITKILGPEEVYKDANGDPIDVLFNPFGSVGRINPGFLLEAAAGKVAAKTGKTFYTDNFEREHDNNLEHVKSEMRKAGVNDAETITNAAGHKIENVMVGPIHTLKLKHKISDKFSARGAGGAYTALDQPKKISGESAQRIGSQDMFSLLSGDAMAFLDDAYRLKGQKNDDYWRALQLGHTLPEPQAPFVAQKFTAMLMASGVNLKQEGSRLDASPMTDAEVMKLSHGEVKNPGTLRSPNLRPMKGGLFDEGITGGPGGSRWTHIELKKPIVNPLMKEAVISVGNFKSGAELERVLDGTLSVDDQGRVLEDDSGTFGVDGVIKVLDSINVQEEIEKTNEAANNARATALNKLNRRLRYLTALKEMNLSPKEAYINSKIPVLPPKFRQITEMPDGSVSVADANHGYRELIMINNQVGDLKELGYDEKTLARLEKSLAQSAGALAGRNAFVTRGREYRGLIEEINGVKESKYGYFKSKVMSRSQDLSARSTVIPNPKLGLDDVGIPKKMGLTIYGPFVVKRLVQGGVAPLEARQMVKDGNDRALDALQLEIEERPVLLSRAPSLHKFSMIGLKPKLVDGKAIEINPLVVAGLNMDFDGDTAGVHVPVSEDARRETLTKMLPSQALVSPRDEFVIHGPSKETVLGIYKLTKPEGEPKSMTMKEAEAQFKKGKLAPNVAIKAGKSVQCYGQKMFNDVFPAGIKPGMRPITGKDLDKILLDVAKETDAKESARILTEIKDLGNQYVTELGYAVSLKDLEFDYKKRDAVIKKLERNSQTKGFGKAVGEATDELSALLAEAVDNRFVEATLESKATGKGDAVRQMIATPVAVTDNKGKLIPIPIRKSFAEGHDLGAYLGTTPGARQGLIDKGISVGATGYLSKLLVRANIENKISQEDCGTSEYIMLPTDSSDAVNRYGAVANFRNVPLTSAMLRKIKREGTKDIAVRSALKCKAQEGICGKCAGIDENGRPYTIGFHLGTQAAQSIGERATQVTLQKFHTGGAVGGASVGFNRIEQLLQLPETVRGRAVLAPESGRITKIEKAPAGGNFVFVNQSGKVFVPQELGLSVKVGDNVKAGDQLTQQGVLKPQDLLSATGDMNKVQDTLINELGAAYGKQRINRRTFETIVKPMTDKVKISNSGDGGTIYNVFAGDIQSKNQIEEYNRKLRERGLREIQFEPILAGIKKIPFLSDDFVGALTHERLKGTLAEAPGMGKSTDFGSGHPVSQLTMKQFGNIADVRGPRPNRL